MSPAVTRKSLMPDANKGEDRKTVLEVHGYTPGETIGTGSYSFVKILSQKIATSCSKQQVQYVERNRTFSVEKEKVGWSKSHNSNVAIKVISKFNAPINYLSTFLPREVEVVKGLRHPNLIRFLQAIETTHRVYIVMEYAENGSLLDIIRKEDHIDETRAKKWFVQLLSAVQYCHERFIAHRDIKCENMLLDAEMNLKLSDFGFARHLSRSANGEVNLCKTFCGSYAYASPEILKGVPYQAMSSDIWSCGVVLYAMVFGKLPFDDSDFSKLLKQVQSPVTFPRQPPVSKECINVITKILAPLKNRTNIPTVLKDPWFGKQEPIPPEDKLAVVPTKTTTSGAKDESEPGPSNQ